MFREPSRGMYRAKLLADMARESASAHNNKGTDSHLGDSTLLPSVLDGVTGGEGTTLTSASSLVSSALHEIRSVVLSQRPHPPRRTSKALLTLGDIFPVLDAIWSSLANKETPRLLCRRR